jgi:hypothetical protein
MEISASLFPPSLQLGLSMVLAHRKHTGKRAIVVRPTDSKVQEEDMEQERHRMYPAHTHTHTPYDRK